MIVLEGFVKLRHPGDYPGSNLVMMECNPDRAVSQEPGDLSTTCLQGFPEGNLSGDPVDIIQGAGIGKPCQETPRGEIRDTRRYLIGGRGGNIRLMSPINTTPTCRCMYG